MIPEQELGPHPAFSQRLLSAPRSSSRHVTSAMPVRATVTVDTAGVPERLYGGALRVSMDWFDRETPGSGGVHPVVSIGTRLRRGRVSEPLRDTTR